MIDERDDGRVLVEITQIVRKLSSDRIHYESSMGRPERRRCIDLAIEWLLYDIVQQNSYSIHIYVSIYIFIYLFPVETHVNLHADIPAS